MFLINKFLFELGDIFREREKLNVWQWGDKYRFFGKGTSNVSEIGPVRYESSLCPHQREIQESFTDAEVDMTVLIGASQIMGKTEMINNLNGYHIHWKPSSLVIMYPNVQSAEKYSKSKFSKMVNATPELAGLIAPARERDSGNTILEKEFPGGSIYFIGSNSAAGMRQASGKVLEADEIDSMEDGKEGDPIELLWARGESYDCVKILSSTPTSPEGRIWKAFEESDQRYWFVPCLKCGHFQTLKWSQVVWPEGKPDQAMLVCSKCNGELTDKQRIEMYYHGEWRPTKPFNGIRGYHFTGIYRMWKTYKGAKNNLHGFAKKHIAAVRKGAQALRVWVNLFLAETYKEEGERPEHQPLLDRREEYGPQLPEGVIILTCQADVQQNRIIAEVKGWGMGQENWGIIHKIIMGKTNLPDVWKRFDEFINTKFEHPYGATLRVACTVVDSGDAVTQKSVYRFVGPRQGRRVFAIKGSNTAAAPLILASLQKKYGIMLYRIGTDVAKSTIYEWIRITEHGPRFMHFPIGKEYGYDEEYAKGCVAEKVETTYVKGFPKRTWVKVYERNDPLDLNAYALAAYDILNPDMKVLARQLNSKRPFPKEYELKPATPSPEVLEKPRKAPRLRRFSPVQFSH